MLAEAGVTVLTGRYLQSVKMTGPRINSVVTGNGIFTGRVLIDGSYEGDLMAAAGVSWTIGREGRAVFNESLALRECLSHLRERQRMLVSQHYRERIAIRKLAEDHGKSESAMKMALMRIRDALRTCIKSNLEGGHHEHRSL